MGPENCVVGRWSLFVGHLCNKKLHLGFQNGGRYRQVVVIDRWSLLGGVRLLRFKCSLQISFFWKRDLVLISTLKVVKQVHSLTLLTCCCFSSTSLMLFWSYLKKIRGEIIFISRFLLIIQWLSTISLKLCQQKKVKKPNNFSRKIYLNHIDQ